MAFLPSPVIIPNCTTRKQVLKCCQTAPQTPTRTSETVINAFWSRSRTGAFTTTIDLFHPDATYIDTLYPTPFKGRDAIEAHLTAMESAIPPQMVFVLDDLAPSENRVGARWHVETENGVSVPFSRGASMYTLEKCEGELLIKEAWDFVETPFKVGAIVLPVLRVVANVLRWSKGKEQSG